MVEASSETTLLVYPQNKESLVDETNLDEYVQKATSILTQAK